MNIVDPVKDNVIFVSDSNTALYITPLKYKLGILDLNPNENELNLQDWAKKAANGENLEYILFPFVDGKLGTDWWDYIVEHRRHFLNKKIVFHVMNLMKSLYKDIAFGKDIRKEFNRDYAYQFFKHYDFCIQSLSTGDYKVKDIVNIYTPLEDDDMYKLMQNHLNILESNFIISKLQEESQLDVINHIINHVILSYYEWQGWITKL